MVLGHASVTAAGRRMLGSRWPRLLEVPLGWLLLGAYLPDLVDKPLNHIVGLSGRAYAHSLIVQVAVFGSLWLMAGLWRGQTSTHVAPSPPVSERGQPTPVQQRLWEVVSSPQMLALWLGSTLHLLEDWVDPATLLAPLLGPIPDAPPWDAFQSFLGFYRHGGPLVWIEMAALVYWLVVAATRPTEKAARLSRTGR